MIPQNRNGKKRRYIHPAEIISVVGAFAIASAPATVAVLDFMNGHTNRGLGMALMAFFIAALPLAGFLFERFRRGE